MKIVNVGYNSTNYYLLDNDKGKLLVDAGWPGTLPKLLHILKTKGINLQDIACFFVTHFHPDHAGLVQELKDAGGKFLLMEEQVSAVPLLRAMIKTEVAYRAIRPGGEIVLPAKDTRTFLQEFGMDGEIIHTPGHSDDGVTLILDSGEAFTGDLPPEIMDPDNSALRQSWNKLRALAIRKIYPGHGPVHFLPVIPFSDSSPD